MRRERRQRGVEDRAVFPFDQAEPAQAVREADDRAGMLGGDDGGGAVLHRRIDRGEGAAHRDAVDALRPAGLRRGAHPVFVERSEEHTSELQSLMRISYAVFCLKKKKTTTTQQPRL